MITTCSSCGHEFDTELAPEMKGACPKCMADFLTGETMVVEPDVKVKPGIDMGPLKAGDSFCGMEIIDFLGRGGMGYVYKAKQTKLDRTVALKVLDPVLAASEEFGRRFNREAKALAALNHPSIVQVFDYGQEDDLHYLVMEFIDGTTLRHILTGQRIEPATALRYVPQICDALEYAHSRGVIHRDIKPENILIDKQGSLKIADFGLAKMNDGTAVDASQLTMTGNVMGTLSYMAPEQLKQFASVDHRADIYALGVVFYEMLTGELPIGRFPAPSESARIDARLDGVVLKALATDPDSRYQQASEVKTDLNATGAAPAAPSAQPASGPRLSKLALWGALGTPLAIVSGLLGAFVCEMFRAPIPTASAATMLAFVALIVGVALSIAGLVVINDSKGRLRGRGVAQFGIFFPTGMTLFFLGTAFLYNSAPTMITGDGSASSASTELIPMFYSAVATAYACFCFIRFLRLRAFAVILTAVIIMGPVVTMVYMRTSGTEHRLPEFEEEFIKTYSMSASSTRLSSPETAPWERLENLSDYGMKGTLLTEELLRIVKADSLSAYTEGTVAEVQLTDIKGQTLKRSEVLDFIKHSHVQSVASGYDGTKIALRTPSVDSDVNTALIVTDEEYEFEVPVVKVSGVGWRIADCAIVKAAVIELLRANSED